MTQIILDSTGANIQLPESRKKNYTVTPVPLYSDVEMISGRLTREYRGTVYEVEYQYGYLEDALKNKIAEICEKGQKKPITCGILLQTNEMIFSSFLITQYNPPQFVWGTDLKGNAVPIWTDLSFTMREVRPHD